MKWKKTPDELALFLKMSLKDTRCEARKMFGYPCYFMNGNMFAGAFGSDIFLRLSPKDIEGTLAKYPNAERFEPRPGTIMKEYVSLPEVIYKSKMTFQTLISKSAKYVRSLPPKKKKRLKH